MGFISGQPCIVNSILVIQEWLCHLKTHIFDKVSSMENPTLSSLYHWMVSPLNK